MKEQHFDVNIEFTLSFYDAEKLTEEDKKNIAKVIRQNIERTLRTQIKNDYEVNNECEASVLTSQNEYIDIQIKNKKEIQ